MSSNDFGGAVIPAMAGFLFGKRAKVAAVQKKPEQQVNLPVIIQVNGLTGVAKYLVSMPLITSVTKYVKKQEKQNISGVERYILRQAIAQKNTPPQTGVAKYMVMAEKNSPNRKKTTVDKYLTRIDFSLKPDVTLTGVAKYQAEQELLVKKKLAKEMIEKYRRQEEVAAMATEIASQAKLTEVETNATETETEELAATGIGRYLQTQAARAKFAPKVTGVAKYVARKIALNSQKPQLSRVEKYLRDQKLSGNKKPALTGVAKYLALQPKSVVRVTNEKIAQSGVSKYLANMSASENAKPLVSGVAKYINKQEEIIAQEFVGIEQIKLIENIIEEVDQTEICLEGEFIPAKEQEPNEQVFPISGVAKYLEKQRVALEDTNTNLSGVSKYLDKQANTAKASLEPATQVTGVERYLSLRN